MKSNANAMKSNAEEPVKLSIRKETLRNLHVRSHVKAGGGLSGGCKGGNSDVVNGGGPSDK
jgi:hypothetical protein